MSTRADDPAIRLRLLATSDLHAHVLAHDYAEDRPMIDAGLDRTAVLIAQARAEVPGAILLDNGDFLHGTPLSDHAAEARASGLDAPDPVIAAMNRLGFDAAALGNHEFDEAPDRLRIALAQARFPVLCANARGARDDAPCGVAPWTVLAREIRGRTVCVGVIGFLPPQTVRWARERLGGALRTRGIVEAARAELPALRAAGAEVVVALCHCGLGADDAPLDGSDGGPGSGDTALALAAVGGIDAVVCGHVHEVFPGPSTPASPGVDPALGRLCGVPAVMPGWRGSHLGVIDLDLAPRPGGGWRVRGSRTEVRAVRDLPPEATGALASEPSVAAAHAATLARGRRPVGRTAVRLNDAFVHVGRGTALDLAAEALRGAARRLLAGGPHGGLPLLSATAPGRAGGRHGAGRFLDIAPGPLTERHLADLCAHPDTLVVLRVSGAELRDWLERAAGRFARVAPGARDAVLLDEAFPSYQFDVIHGVGYAFDLSQPARFDAAGREAAPGARRLVRLEHEGREVQDDDAFAVATKSHRVAGEGLYAPLAARPRLAADPTPLRDVLARHVAEHSPLRASEPLAMGFASPPGGATALFPGPIGAEPPEDGPIKRVERRAGPGCADPCPDGPWCDGCFDVFRLRL